MKESQPSQEMVPMKLDIREWGGNEPQTTPLIQKLIQIES